MKDEWIEIMKSFLEAAPFVICVLVLTVAVSSAGTFIVAALGAWSVVIVAPVTVITLVSGIAFFLVFWSQRFR